MEVRFQLMNAKKKKKVQLYSAGVSGGSPQHPDPQEHAQGGGPIPASRPAFETAKK